MALEYGLMGLGLWNIIVAFIYGLDKWFAIQSMNRISEFTLIFLAFSFAGLGALLGMLVCHHKTRKWKFKVAIPIALLWQTFSIGYACFYFM